MLCSIALVHRRSDLAIAIIRGVLCALFEWLATISRYRVISINNSGKLYTSTHFVAPRDGRKPGIEG